MSPSGTDTAGLLDPAFLRKLDRLSIAVKRVRAGVLKGERKSTKRGQSIDFADYRGYVQGDDLRHVDWNLYGRLDELYLKLFEEREDLTLHLMIDASKSMGFGTPTKLAFAQRLAAALGYIALSGHERVSVEAFTGDSARRSPPVRGKNSVPRLFDFLGRIDADGATHLEESGRSYLSRNKSKGVAVMLSDFFDEAGFEGVLRRLQQSRSDVYAVQILAPEEVNPKLTGDLKLVDSETGNFAEISASRALFKRYQKNREGFVESIRRYCATRGIGYVFASSDTPIEEITLHMFRRIGMVQG